jgi:hypothetical protein
MAKTSDSKSEQKKLQKEIASLKSKLKAAEKSSKSSARDWQKKHSAFEKEVKGRLLQAYSEGYAAATSENKKREVARKKAIQSAESAFDKSYVKKEGKPKGAKKLAAAAKPKRAAKAKAAPKATAKAKKASAKPAAAAKKSAKPEKVAKVKTKGAKVSAKRRGRPAKPASHGKQERATEGHQVAHEETSSHSNQSMDHLN